MKPTLLLLLLATAAVASLPQTTLACSDFLYNSSLWDTARDGPAPVISGRTMDFAADLQSVLEVVPRGTSFQELPVLACADCADYQWTNPLGFVAVNMYGLNVATDGMNEKGLSAAWLYLPGTVYPRPETTNSSETNASLPIVTAICTYLLGNFGSVAELREGIKHIQFAEFDERLRVLLHPQGEASLGRVPLHVAVHDASGQNLVIEFLGGKTTLYDNVNDVLTNSPTLDEQLDALAENGYKDFPGGYGSTERFLRVSVLNRLAPLGYSNALPNATYIEAAPQQRAVSNVLHILNTVVRPIINEATEWSIVRDHANLKLYIQSTQNQLLRRVDFSQIDFASAASRRLIPVTFGNWYADVTQGLTDESNTAKTADLPPRTQMEGLIRQIMGDEMPASDPPAVAGPASLVAASEGDASAEPSQLPAVVFGAGLFCGVLVAVVVPWIVNRSRRQGYQQVPDPSSV